MNKLLTLLLLIVLFGCNKKPERLKNGLTKSANEVIEYIIQIQKDSLDFEIRDTLLITTENYGKNDKLIQQNRKTLFDNQEMQIEYIYNSNNQIKQEIVKMSTDSLPLEVNYSYKNSLLIQTNSILDNNSEKFEQIETYFYRKNKTKEKSIMTQIYIDKISNDTINNSIVNAFYNQDEKNDSIIIINLKYPELKRKSIYEYDDSEFISVQEFNHNDSLISSENFKYKMDKFDNWIEKRIIENGILKTIVTRKIEYK